MIFKKMGKRGQLGYDQIIFLSINIFIFCALLFFVWRSSSESTVIEEAYAKKIALLIDQLKPGTELNLSVNDLYKVIQKNKFSDFPIHIENNIVNVKAEIGKGYDFRFFSNISPLVSIDTSKEDKILTIKA
jgi:uncharacterized protein YpmS